MKALIYSLALFLLSGAIIAQEPIDVAVTEKNMSQGTQTSFVVVVPEAEQDFVETSWKKYANDRSLIESITKGAAGRLIGNAYKSVADLVSQDKERVKNTQKLKVEKENDEFIVRNVVHDHVTQNFLDIYARIVKIEGGTQVSTFFRFADSIFINESNVDEETLLSIKNYIYEFGVETYKEVVENQIREAERELRRMNVVLSNMESKVESHNKSISRAESEINKCESDIKLNKEQISRINEKISETNRQKLSHKKKSIEYESYKDLLKEHKKEKKKLQRQNKRLKTRIKKQEGKIKKALADIVENELDQKDQQLLIEKQEQEIAALELKLSQIQ